MLGHVEEPGPNELRDPLIRQELKKAAVWVGLVVLVSLIWLLTQPLLLIIGGIVFASMLDGGARLLGKALPIGRQWRLLLVVLGVIAFLAWVVVLAGTQLVQQFETMRLIIEQQTAVISVWAARIGLLQHPEQFTEIGKQILSSLGRVTSAVTSVFGALTSVVLIVVIGVFLAIEPRLYERGIAWMFPIRSRDRIYGTMSAMGATLRRLMAGRLVAMFFEGVSTYFLLLWGNVPMAALLGVLTGLLAFLPNIGALISGGLMILVGFSAGVSTGYWAIGVYLFVHTLDGYLIVPMVARRSVDLAPALVLGTQLIFGALFGVLGLALADPIVVMLKVALERESEKSAMLAGVSAG